MGVVEPGVPYLYPRCTTCGGSEISASQRMLWINDSWCDNDEEMYDFWCDTCCADRVQHGTVEWVTAQGEAWKPCRKCGRWMSKHSLAGRRFCRSCRQEIEFEMDLDHMGEAYD